MVYSSHANGCHGLSRGLRWQEGHSTPIRQDLTALEPKHCFCLLRVLRLKSYAGVMLTGGYWTELAVTAVQLVSCIAPSHDGQS